MNRLFLSPAGAWDAHSVSTLGSHLNVEYAPIITGGKEHGSPPRTRGSRAIVQTATAAAMRSDPLILFTAPSDVTGTGPYFTAVATITERSGYDQYSNPKCSVQIDVDPVYDVFARGIMDGRGDIHARKLVIPHRKMLASV